MKRLPIRLAVILVLGSCVHLTGAQTTWSQAVLPGAPYPSDLWLTSASGGQNQFDFTLGGGGSMARMRASRESNKELLPYGSHLTNINTQWGLMAGTVLDDGDPATDDRFYLCQAGTSGQTLAPTMQVEKNATTQAVDVYAVAQDQWSSHLQSAVQAKVSHLVRYEPLADGSVKVRRVIRFGSATVNGASFDISAPFFENMNTFHVANFNALAEKLKSNGTPETYYNQGYNIPQNAQADVSQSNGYVVVYNRDDTVNRAAVGVVFGKSQMSGANQMIVNYSDSATAISVRPGIRLSNAAPGSVLDVTYYLVPGYGLNAGLVTRLNNLVAATPAPVVYPAGTVFSGELAGIVQRLNDNLALAGVRTDRLGYDVTAAPVTARPMLLSGPEDDADIRARLAIFPQRPESLLKNYLYGTDADKQTATNYFFRYPGNGDGNGLRSEYISQMSRALMWDLYRYDIALGLGKATAAQKQQMQTLAEAKINALFPYFKASRAGGNLALEDDIALGLAALDFPENPNAQLWLSRSVTYTKQIMDGYFPDGSGNESPRYQDWVLDLMSKYMHVLKRRINLDLYDEPWARSSLDWFIRYSSPPLAELQNKSVTPAWGDATYSSIASGDSHFHYYYDLSLFAQAYKERDPDFAARLMYWWRKNGSPLQLYNAGSGSLTNSFLIDPRIPAYPQRPNTSTYSAWRGSAALHGNNGSDDEMMATFLCGANGGVHSDADMGTFDLFAFGVPLVLDSTSGPYISGTTFNENTFAHNTVTFNGTSGGDVAGGQFLGFGTSAVADYVSAKTPYAPSGSVSNRHMVMVKPDYLVIWDENTTSYYADWYLHTPGNGTLEWQPHKVVSHTASNVDLDIHFVLPDYALAAPTYPGRVLNSSDASATANPLASAAADPGTVGAFTTQGQSRFGDGSTSRNPFGFQWQNYFSVRNTGSSRNFLTVLHPRKTGVTPVLATQLISASSAGVKLQVTCNGRVDTIEITTTGATVTKGTEPVVQFAKTYPQSGAAGTAGYVKADFSFNPVTTLASALATTGPVEVHTGTLALGANERIPDTSTLHILPGGTFDLAGCNETVGTFIADGGRLTGAGTLKPSAIEWWGGRVDGNVAASGNMTIKTGNWSPTSHITYTGATILEKSTLTLQPGGADLPGNKLVTLAEGSTLNANGANTTLSGLAVTGAATIATGSATLKVAGAITGTGSLANNGTLDISGATSISTGLTLSNNGMITLPAGAVTVRRLIVNGAIQRAGTVHSAATNPGSFAGSGTIVALEDVGVPANLSAAATLGQVRLTWTPLSGAASYIIRRSTVSGTSYVQIGTATQPVYDDVNVANGVTYYYTVSASTALGEGSPCPEVPVVALAPLYFDPNGAAAGSVANGGAYTWVSSSWANLPGGTNPVAAWPLNGNAQFAASTPGSPLNYSVGLTGFSGAANGFKSMRVTNGTVTFTGTPGNFYFTQPSVITADADAVLRFAQTGPLAFNLNKQVVTFDGAGTTLVSADTAIINIGSIVKTGTGTLVLAASNTYSGNTSVQGGVLRLAVTDLPTLWLDATNARTLAISGGTISQWNDASGRGTYASQASESNRPVLVSDASIAGPANALVDFGSFVLNATTTGWMQFNADMTDIRALFWVGKTTNENFLLGSTTVHDFHSGGAGSTIWSSNTSYSAANLRNGTTWLNGAEVPGTTTNMPAAANLVRIGAFTTGTVNANTIGRDRTYRSGGLKTGEVMICNTVLTTQQQADIDAYLAKKWNNTGAGIGNRLPVTTKVTLSNGGVLDLTGINYQTIAGLDANDNSDTMVLLGAAELVVSGGEATTFDGVISGSGSLRKAGAGVFTLEGGNTYTGPTVVEAGTLDIESSITSNVTVKSGATLVNNGTVKGNLIMENGATYLGSGIVTGLITTAPPVVTINSPAVDGTIMGSIDSDLNLTADVVFNTAMGKPVLTWTMVAGPGAVTFGNPSSTTTTARFPVAGTYTLRCTATATVNGQILQGYAERVVRPGGPPSDAFTGTFREGESGYAHTCALIRSDWPTGNAGVRDQMIVGTGFRSVFSFPLTGIPAAASVQSAQLDVYVYEAVSSLIGELELRHLTGNPVEGTGDGSASTSGVGSGVSWTSRTGALDWTNAGGDYESGASQWLAKVPAFSTAAVGDVKSFQTTNNFKATVQAAVAGGAPLDLIIISPTTTATNRYVRLVSDDHTTAALRPRLTVNYSVVNACVPQVEPGVAPTVATGVAAALAGSVANGTSGANGTYWSLVSGPGDASFSDAGSLATTVTFSKPGTYLLRCSSSNANGAASRTLSVNVSPNPNVFTDWQGIHWPGVTMSDIIGDSADPDGDGTPNLMEFALNMTPDHPDRPLISLQTGSQGLSFTYTRARNAMGIAWSVEWSDTMLPGSWSSQGVSESVIDNTRPDTQTIRANIPSGAARKFVRLRVAR